MTISVVNLRWDKAPDFYCGRASPLGNPFQMRDKSPAERDRVCDEYYKYFHTNLNPDVAPFGFLEYLDKILQAAVERNITLGCWCAPKRCHCDIIKDYLDREVKEYERRKAKY